MDQDEQNIVQQAADRFDRDLQHVRVLGAVPLRNMAGGDTILLPLKVRLPNMPDASTYITASLQWWGRPQSEVWERLPTHLAIANLLEAIVAMNDLHRFVLTMYIDDEEVDTNVVLAQYMHGPLYIKIKVHDPTVDILQERGGARRRRPNQPAEETRRSTMQGWASQRILDHADIEPRIARVLVRAEQRTVSAVLAARSPAQLLHVVKAALHRNGYGEAARRVARQIPSRHTRAERSSSPSQQRGEDSSPSPTHGHRQVHEVRRERNDMHDRQQHIRGMLRNNLVSISMHYLCRHFYPQKDYHNLSS